MSPEKPALLSVVILTKDEEKNLPHALNSLKPLSPDIFVVDSGSTDRTVEIAKAYGCHVVYHEFESHAAQLNWALGALPIKTPWVMRLDADERLMPQLVEELRVKLPTLGPKITALMLKRRVYFWGKWIRYGGYYPTWLLRIWRRGKAVCEQRWMDEHMVVKEGQPLHLENDIIDENHKGLSFWINKHNSYSDREVMDLLNEPEKNEKLEGQALRRRWLKNKVYRRSPLFLRAMMYWIFRYVMLLGFLDGKAGFVFHFLQGFWYRMLVDAKLHERIKRSG